MQRVAFKMKIFKGQEAEYQRRHDWLWPELKELLEKTGVREYSIFLDDSTLSLCGVLKIDSQKNLDDLPHHPVMKKWWYT